MKTLLLIFSALFLLTGLTTALGQEVKINHNGTDGLAVEADGTLRADGAATTYDDLRVTLDKGSDAAKLKNIIGDVQIWHFENNRDDVMSFTVQLPHTYKEGTNIFPHIHWVPTTSGTGNVEWQFEYSWANFNSTFPALTTLTSVGSAGGTALAHKITAFSDGGPGEGIDGTGKTISSILLCRIRRDAGQGNDTYSADVGALYFDIHIEVNTMGSRSEYSK